MKEKSFWWANYNRIILKIDEYKKQLEGEAKDYRLNLYRVRDRADFDRKYLLRNLERIVEYFINLFWY